MGLRGDNDNGLVARIFSAEAVTAGSDATSGAIRTNLMGGFFSLDYTITGTGAWKFEMLLSADGVTYFEPDGVSDIKTGTGAASGLIQFAVPLGNYIKIKVTETGSANPITVTADLVAK